MVISAVPIGFESLHLDMDRPASHVSTIVAAIEDVRSSIGDDSLASLIRSANDELDAELDSVVD